LNRSGTASATAVEHLYHSTLEIGIWIHLAQKDLLEDSQFLQVSLQMDDGEVEADSRHLAKNRLD
ncbi:MAG: hypothetical protein N0E37_02585, partial [Candidatus Thiodiazotropha taylori]|nr:hypothetical protein [Candidatus Thiodiazotropha taylori]